MLEDTHTILTVDDDPLNLKMLEHLLKRDFKTLTASSGEAALEILKYNKVSLIITDQRMPGMTGTELLRKSRAIDPDLVCILMTANKDAVTVIDATMKSGALRVINKPLKPEEVKHSVQTALERYESLVQNKQAFNRLKAANVILERIKRNQ